MAQQTQMMRSKAEAEYDFLWLEKYDCDRHEF